jgi:hypothetical protein
MRKCAGNFCPLAKNCNRYCEGKGENLMNTPYWDKHNEPGKCRFQLPKDKNGITKSSFVSDVKIENQGIYAICHIKHYT